MTTLVLFLLGGMVVALAALVARQTRRARRLERLVAHTSEKLEQLQIQFGRFAPPAVIEQLAERGESGRPSRRQVTVLFADLRGFTRMCDSLDPAETVAILNGYFRCMNEAIKGHHGKVTELTGDGILALFGALESNPWQSQDAVLGALAMRAALAHYNGELKARARPELAFGVGIHRGEVLAGVMGNEELSKFGVVGDPINVAARVESLTRQHGVDILITEEVRRSLDGRFRLRAMPALPVKGKPAPIGTYFVEGLEDSPL